MAHRILAVDDNEIMRQVYMDLLSEEGYDVTVARDGKEGLSALKRAVPDLILLDIDMPDLSGWEVLEIIRATPEWRDIPTIMVTVLPEPPASEEDSYPRHDCYLTKKKTGNDLLALVQQGLNGELNQRGAD